MINDDKTFCAKFAEYVFEVEAPGGHLKDFCKDYIEEDQKPDFHVEITNEDVKLEAEKYNEYYGLSTSPCDESERLALLRKISEELIKKEVILLHSSAISYKGKAYVFTARSGTGKTTHAALWREMLGKETQMINDDKPFIKVERDNVTAFGTPWAGKENLSSNISAPVRGILCLVRADENRVEQMSENEKWDFLINQVHRSPNPDSLKETLRLLGQMIEQVPVYRLLCNREPGAAKVAFEAFRSA